MLVDGGMAVAEAIKRCGTNLAYFRAMKALRESGDVVLYVAVLRGDEPVLGSARRVKNATGAIRAYRKCSPAEQELLHIATGATSDPVTMLAHLAPAQLVAAAQVLGLDWIWDNMIAAAMPTRTSNSKAPSTA
jgi:hypothetical protein